MSEHRGAYVTIDGGEGGGKSSQAIKLAERTGAFLTREPGGTRAGSYIREILLDHTLGELTPTAEVLLFSADRTITYETFTKPRLLAGRSVVSDRSYLSTMAYQQSAHGLPYKVVEQATNLALGTERADKQVIFDIDYDTAMQRMIASGKNVEGDRFERLGEDFHNKVRNGFLNLARNLGERAVLIDASGTVEEVGQELFDQVGSLLIEGVRV